MGISNQKAGGNSNPGVFCVLVVPLIFSFGCWNSNGSDVGEVAALEENRAAVIDPLEPLPCNGLRPCPEIKITHMVEPIFGAGHLKIEGKIVIHLTLAEDGSVKTVELTKGLLPELDNAVIRAAGQWTFSTTDDLGQTVVPCCYTLTVRFDL